MTCEFRWRRAITVSIIVHIFFLVGSGYMAVSLFAVPPVTEQNLELDLVYEPQIEVPEDNSVPQPQTPVAVPVSPPVIPQVKTPIPVPKVVTPVSDTTPVTNQVQPIAGNIASSYVPATPAAPAGGKPAAGNSSGKKSGGVIPPGVLAKVDAKYPQAARQAGIEGAVMLKVKVLANGRPGDVMIARSSGHGMLDNAAVDAIKRWRFVPAKDRESGRAIECFTTIPVTFRLDS